MKKRMYVQSDRFTAGITMKDPSAEEQNNMGLHTADRPDAVIRNRERLAACLKTDLSHFVCAHQTHSDHFHRVTIADKGRGARDMSTAIKDTDALYTSDPGVVLCSFTADCVPVLLIHEEKGMIAAVHSGWSGTVKEVTVRLLRHLIDEEGCSPDGFTVFIGPAISQRAFETDEDVFLKFKQLRYADPYIDFCKATGKYHIDNQAVVRTQCERAGIPVSHISIDRMCTHNHPDGFSYREDKGCGRHLSFIVKHI